MASATGASFKPNLLMLAMKHVVKAAAVFYIKKVRRKDTVGKTLYLFETKLLKQCWSCSNIKFAYIVLIS